jgi:uncharacterized protein
MRLSMTRGLVAAIGAGGLPRGEPGAIATAGWELLSRIDALDRAAVNEVLAYPYVQAWAVRCVTMSGAGSRELDRAHLAGVAAAAALRAGREAELVLPLMDGAVHLPGSGAFFPAAAVGTGVRVAVSGAGIASLDAEGEWVDVRRGTGGLPIAVDDLDPYRDCQDWPVTGRLPERDRLGWCESLTAAWQDLDRHLPAYARTLAAGLRAVVPLQPGHGAYRSGTAWEAFGAVALALPSDPAVTAELLVHEFQHVKLNALLDLHDLITPGRHETLTVPWRPDARPLEGVLHGVYAHLAIADLWRSRARTDATREAEAGFNRCRAWVLDTIAALRATGALTPDGLRFADGMHASAARDLDTE